MGKITYEDKVAISVDPSVADINKTRADDFNEIKRVVNGNDNIVTILTTKVDLIDQEVKKIQNYSTDEINTGKKWINTKPIYRKVVAVDFPTSARAIATTPHGITGIDQLIEYNLIWYDTTDGRFYNTFKDTSGTYYVEMDGVTPSDVWVKANVALDWQGRTTKRYAILEYTKN